MTATPKIFNYVAAAGAGVIANVILGLSSLYWRELAAIPATTLLGYRISLSLATLSIVMVLSGRFRGIQKKITEKSIAIHGAAAVLLVVNWGTFIWASIRGHVVESGLGYLVAPFISIGGGVLIFKDRMSVLKRLSLVLIAAGVLTLIARSSELNHWVYLTIGVTWGGYTWLKKVTSLDAFEGLFCENIVLSIFLMVMVFTPLTTMNLPKALPDRSLVMLAVAGFVSVTPLWLFSKATSSLPLSIMGFFQFFLPITQLVVALIFYHQSISSNTAFCFGAICMAVLVIFTEPFVQRFILMSKRN